MRNLYIAAGSISLTLTVNKVIFRRKLRLHVLGRSFWNRKNANYLLQFGSNLEHLNQNLPKTTAFYQHSQALYEFMRKKNENLEFVQCVNFEFIDSLKNDKVLVNL